MSMTLVKAIEILNHHKIHLGTVEDHDFFDAIKLGIEAIKFFQSVHRDPGHPKYVPLPGETECL